MPKPFPRRGAWVTKGKKVGIIAALDGDAAEVHFTDEHGDTAEVVKDIPVASLAQAARMEIPKKRRPTAELAKQFGYE
jgi:hypothetical protein